MPRRGIEIKPTCPIGIIRIIFVCPDSEVPPVQLGQSERPVFSDMKLCLIEVPEVYSTDITDNHQPQGRCRSSESRRLCILWTLHPSADTRRFVEVLWVRCDIRPFKECTMANRLGIMKSVLRKQDTQYCNQLDYGRSERDLAYYFDCVRGLTLHSK